MNMDELRQKVSKKVEEFRKNHSIQPEYLVVGIDESGEMSGNLSSWQEGYSALKIIVIPKKSYLEVVNGGYSSAVREIEVRNKLNQKQVEASKAKHYEFMILQHCPNEERGEWVNVGVLLMSREAQSVYFCYDGLFSKIEIFSRPCPVFERNERGADVVLDALLKAKLISESIRAVEKKLTQADWTESAFGLSFFLHRVNIQDASFRWHSDSDKFKGKTVDLELKTKLLHNKFVL